MKSTRNCEELIELIPAYRLGATDDDDTRAIESAFNDCPELIEELARWEPTERALADSVPQVTPPPQVLDGLLEKARTTPMPVRAPKSANRRLWWVVAASIALFIVANNVFWISRVTPSEGGRGRQIVLPAADENANTNASGRLIWSPAERQIVLIAVDMPPLPPDSAYQLWVRRDQTITSLGVFQVDTDGNGSLVFPVELLSTPFDAVGVTLESAEGNPAPTSPALIRWQAAES